MEASPEEEEGELPAIVVDWIYSSGFDYHERYQRSGRLEGNNHLALVWLPACYIGELKPYQRLQDHNVQERILPNYITTIVIMKDFL
jgi:hypothetical protein